MLLSKIELPHQMHELSATQGILNIALTEACKAGAAEVERIHLIVGKWCTFQPECLRRYFNIIARGTQAEGADLVITSAPVRFACADCGLEYTPGESEFSCPGCSGSRGRLISGREFYIQAIEVR